MEQYLLVKVKCPERGTGLRIAIPSSVKPDIECGGVLAAHDIIEHPNGPTDIGLLTDELQALGGFAACRGYHVYSIADANETFDYVLNVLSKYYRGDEPFSDYDYSQVAEDEVLMRLYSNVEARISASVSLSEDYRKLAIHYVRMGVAKYCAKYGFGRKGPNLFKQIQTKVDTLVEIGVPHSAYLLTIENNQVKIGVYCGS